MASKLEPPTVSTTPAADEDICFQQCSVDFLIRLKDEVLRKKAYQCDSKFRGRALIMNNMNFANNFKGTRYGSDVDTENLKKLFNRLHFDTVVHRDKTAADMMTILENESREDHHKDYDMFVLFLMSHGIQGEIFGIDCDPRKTVDISNLFNGINCPNLLEKPKLFFIQACQGDVDTEGVRVGAGTIARDSLLPGQDSSMDQMMKKLSLEEDFNLSIPIEPMSEFQRDGVAHGMPRVHELVDMAFFYATIQGYAAYRNEKTGSLFVNCLIDFLKKEAHQMDLVAMATPIMNDLHELEVEIDGRHYKAAGEFRHRLRRFVYLLPLPKL